MQSFRLPQQGADASLQFNRASDSACSFHVYGMQHDALRAA